MVVEPDGGPGTVVAELLAANVRLVSVAASKAVAAAPAARTARRGDRFGGLVASGGLVLHPVLPSVRRAAGPPGPVCPAVDVPGR